MAAYRAAQAVSVESRILTLRVNNTVRASGLTLRRRLATQSWGWTEPCRRMLRVSHEGLAAAGFFHTGLSTRLAADPVGLIDVGARWGISPEFRVASRLFAALAFEPDAAEAARIVESAADQGWADFDCAAVALGAAEGEVDLHLYSRANNSSVFPVSEQAKRRYALTGFDLTEKLTVPVAPLDPIVRRSGVRAGEVIKLDTQGAELDILRGGVETLRDRCICLVTEAQFFALYDGAPQFTDIDTYVRAHGLTLIGFSDFQNRSTKQLDKRSHWGRERVFQADAIYFRDPAVADKYDARGADVAVLMAVLLGYFDLALEWVQVAQRNGGDMRGVPEAIAGLSRVSPDDVQTTLHQLSAAVRAEPDLGHAILGKFVDSRRDLTTFHDIATAAPPAPPNRARDAT